MCVFKKEVLAHSTILFHLCLLTPNLATILDWNDWPDDPWNTSHKKKASNYLEKIYLFVLLLVKDLTTVSTPIFSTNSNQDMKDVLYIFLIISCVNSTFKTIIIKDISTLTNKHEHQQNRRQHFPHPQSNCTKRRLYILWVESFGFLCHKQTSALDAFNKSKCDNIPTFPHETTAHPFPWEPNHLIPHILLVIY